MTIIKPVASPCNNILILAANPSLMTDHYAHNSSETCPTLLQATLIMLKKHQIRHYSMTHTHSNHQTETKLISHENRTTNEH
jgi:hypothetical protein